jgi:hypothetical protein
MKRISVNVLRSLATLAVAALAAGCVTPVEEAQWDDVGAFSWPTELGTTMRYKVASQSLDNGGSGNDSTIAEIRAGNEQLNGAAMYRIRTTFKGEQSKHYSELHFLPTRDTLYTTKGLIYESGLQATYALVSPLEPGHTWIAAYATGTDSATVRATIVERYSYWKLEGKAYENVVAVRYETIGPSKTEEWIRFYAKDIGPILTIKNVYPLSNGSFNNPPSERDRATLVETTSGE